MYPRSRAGIQLNQLSSSGFTKKEGSWFEHPQAPERKMGNQLKAASPVAGWMSPVHAARGATASKAKAALSLDVRYRFNDSPISN
jgi:hypothetical protein